MEILRKVINSDKLKDLFSIPESMEGSDVEVLVFPIKDRVLFKKTSDIETILNSITGIIQDEGMSLNDYREERLKKYAGID